MPVEKVDKPEPPPTYYVEATVQTKDDRGKRQDQQQSDEYSGSHAAPGWQKIYASSSNRRYLKLRREDITRAWFRGTVMQRGISLAEVDIQLKDNRVLKSAHVILTVREDFWTLKKFQPGQDIPLHMLIKDPTIEISVPAPKPPPHQQPRQTEVQKPKKFDLNFLKTFVNENRMYVYVGAVIVFLLLFFLIVI